MTYLRSMSDTETPNTDRQYMECLSNSQFLLVPQSLKFSYRLMSPVPCRTCYHPRVSITQTEWAVRKNPPDLRCLLAYQILTPSTVHYPPIHASNSRVCRIATGKISEQPVFNAASTLFPITRHTQLLTFTYRPQSSLLQDVL